MQTECQLGQSGLGPAEVSWSWAPLPTGRCSTFCPQVSGVSPEATQRPLRGRQEIKEPASYTQMHRKELRRWPHLHRRGMGAWTCSHTSFELGRAGGLDMYRRCFTTEEKCSKGPEIANLGALPPAQSLATSVPLLSYLSYSATIWLWAILQVTDCTCSGQMELLDQ